MAETYEDFIEKRARRRKLEQEQLVQSSGFFYEVDVNDTARVNIFGTRLKTDIESPDEVAEIVRSLNISELDEILFSRLAKAYALKHAIMFEGDPGAGKTFVPSKFNEFIHGRDEKPLVMTCSPKMTELEIIGHWMPSPGGRDSASPVIKDVYRQFDAAAREYNLALRGYEQQIASAKDREAIDMVAANFEPHKLRYLKEVDRLRTETASQVEWAFNKGFLLDAYVGNKGKGRVLIVDELGLLPSNIQQVFLQAVAEKGQISDRLVIKSNAGQAEYPRGEDTYICFATNFPEHTSGRNVVAAPMTDRLEWYTLPRDLVNKKEDELIRAWNTTFRLDKKKIADGKDVRVVGELRERSDEFNIRTALGGDIARIFGDRLALFHQEFKNYIKVTPDKFDDEERIQILETSTRRALHVMNHIEYALKESPPLDPEGKVDLEAAFRAAVISQYADRIFHPTVRDGVIKMLDRFLVTPSTGSVQFRGKNVTARQALLSLKEEYARQEFAAQAGKPLSQIEEEHDKRRAFETFEEDEKTLIKFEQQLDTIIELAEGNYKRFCKGV